MIRCEWELFWYRAGIGQVWGRYEVGIGRYRAMNWIYSVPFDLFFNTDYWDDELRFVR